MRELASVLGTPSRITLSTPRTLRSLAGSSSACRGWRVGAPGTGNLVRGPPQAFLTRANRKAPSLEKESRARHDEVPRRVPGTPRPASLMLTEANSQTWLATWLACGPWFPAATSLQSHAGQSTHYKGNHQRHVAARARKDSRATLASVQLTTALSCKAPNPGPFRRLLLLTSPTERAEDSGALSATAHGYVAASL